jgi:hypothetical protein
MLRTPPLFRRLEGAERVLIAGAGGGFDVLAGLPLYFALAAMGKRVHLANLTFSYMGATDARAVTPHLYEVRADTTGDPRYFPEKHLATWLREHGHDDRVMCLEKTGLAPMRAAYARLAASLDLDAVVLVDGGADILMHGDEAGLGTPAEDMTSLLAAHALDVPTKLVTCVGFGVDAFHGVSHRDVLENVAALAKSGAYLGALSLMPDAPEVEAWLSALLHVQSRTPGRESIVNASVADAVRGEFGDHRSVPRTRESPHELFINPLMSLLWSFELDALAQRCLYARALASTQTIFEVHAVIEAFRRETKTRPRRPIPL